MTKLAILIPTLTKRAHLLDRVVKELDRQRVGKDVILLINEDKGEKTTGQKRNELIETAVNLNVQYIAFVDDDDMIGPTYVQRGLEVVESGFDCGELWGHYYQKGKLIKAFHHSIKYEDWYEEKDYFCRMPNHLNFQKLEKVKDIKFPNQVFGEDGKQSYAMKDAGVLKTEYPIKDILYHYYK